MARADALTALAQDIAAADPGSFWLWTLLFLAWWMLGLPLGPGAPVR